MEGFTDSFFFFFPSNHQDFESELEVYLPSASEALGKKEILDWAERTTKHWRKFGIASAWRKDQLFSETVIEENNTLYPR